ncbi:MAG: thioredoxin family protein, partial [bacterium]|nr:thioredoxin family protein [bacterium]
NERTVLTHADVRSRFAAMDVVMVKADWTSRNAEITKMLRAFGRSGVPLYVIFPGGKPEHPLVLPEVITVGILLDGLQRAQILSRG